MSSAAQHDFLPTAAWEILQLRAELVRRVREFFYTRCFVEVETPILSADTVVDRHLEPFFIDLSISTGAPPRRLWLQTSPEFHMKRLLAAGAKAIFQVSRVFRRDEQGPLHNPEFTMLEWYRVGDRMDDGMQLTGELAEALLERGPAEKISYREAFERHAGIDPFTAEGNAILSAVKKNNIEPPASLSSGDRDGWLDLLLVECVQPRLGFERPMVLYDFPASQAALSCVRPEDPPVAERFELYVDGIELANGYHELLDAEELLRRNRETNRLRQAEGNTALPEESRLAAAMRSGIPPSVGAALGFDRLVMLAAGAKMVSEVIAFPFDRA
jgi:lysyl-tRNA synthetase class 2